MNSHFYCLATASVNQTPLDWEGNCQRIVNAVKHLIDKRKKLVPDLILFPELCVSAYGCEDAFHFPQVWQQACQTTQKIAKLCHKLAPQTVVIVGLPFLWQGALYNCAAVLANGEIMALVPKTSLANEGAHYEQRWFCSFSGRKVIHVPIQGQSPAAFGLMAFTHNNTARFIIETCRDAWVLLSRPAHILAEANYNLVLNPSASHFAFDKHELRRNIILESSRRLGVAFALTNPLGCEAGRLIFDGHRAIAYHGTWLQESLSFSFQDFTASSCLLDLAYSQVEKVRQHHSHNTYQTTHQPNVAVTILDISTPQAKKKNPNVYPYKPSHTLQDSTITVKRLTQNEQFARAVSLGLFDYLRKSKGKGFVISLSGGVDSSACAILVQQMMARAISELGTRTALLRLGREDLVTKVTKISPNADLKTLLAQVMPHLLYTLYQATDNNTEDSRKAAQEISKVVNSTHQEYNIQEQVDAYLKTVEQILQTSLTAKNLPQYNLAKQNIQARTRAPLPWLLANATGSILLTTANRSEVAVGYSTMDGDTAGGLAPLAGVDKSFLQQWLLFMEAQGDSLPRTHTQAKASK